MTERAAAPAVRRVNISIDGVARSVREGTTILEACREAGIETPTLCYLENLTPINVCRICVVEVEGSRALVPACSRTVDPDMVIRTGLKVRGIEVSEGEG